MRYARMLFGLPFAVMLCAFTLAGPDRAFAYDDPIATVIQATHYLDNAVMLVQPEHVAITAEEQRHDALSSAGDAHALAYEIGNQPGANWRTAVDNIFAIIDPHIRLS